MAITYHGGNIIRGTAADRTGGTWTNLQAGYIFIESDTFAQYYWNGTTWNAMGGGGGAGGGIAPAKITVYFDGTNWVAKNPTGTTLTSSATAQTVLQYAFDNLTAARTWKEVVKFIGNATISTLTIPSYTALDLYGSRLQQANSAHVNMLINSDTTGGNTDIDIYGGVIDGNKANQTEDAVPYNTRNTINFTKVTNGSVYDCRIIESNSTGVYVRDGTNVSVHDNTILNAEKLGIYFDASAIGAGKYLYARDNYIAGQDENPAASQGCSDVWIEGNECNGNTVTSGINCNGARIHINHNHVFNMQTFGLSIGIEGTYSSDESEICYNFVENCALGAAGGGGISVNAAAVSDRVLVIGNRSKGATSPGTTNQTGLRVSASENTIIKNNMVWNWQAMGIYFSGNNVTFTPDGRLFDCKNVIIADNICFDNGKNTGLTTTSRAGIAIANGSTSGYVANILKNIDVHGNRCYDNGAGTQLHGIYIRSTDDCWVHDNDVRGNITAGIFADANNVNLSLRNNTGYITDVDYEDSLTTTAPANPATSYTRRYAKQVDANNDGYFIKTKVNGAVQEIRIA